MSVHSGHEQYVNAVDRVLAEVWRLREGKRVTAASPDDSVSVTVDGNGTVLAIDLARRPSRWPSLAECGAAIRDTVNAARSTAARRSERLVDRTLRADPELAVFGIAELAERSSDSVAGDDT